MFILPTPRELVLLNHHGRTTMGAMGLEIRVEMKEGIQEETIEGTITDSTPSSSQMTT
jgi:hypothetical protein